MARDLVEVTHGVVGKAAGAETADSREVALVLHHAGRCRHRQRLVVVLGGDVPDATEAPLAGGLVRVEHSVEVVVEEICRTHDGRDFCAAGGDAGLRGRSDELRLTDRTERRRPVGPILGAAFQEDCAHDVVAAACISVQVSQRVGPTGMAFIEPQVMVRIADRQVGFQGLLMDLREPGRVRVRSVVNARRP
jgi:hypothetical protein